MASKPTLQPPKAKFQPLERALKAENLKLQKQVARLKAKIVTLENRIKILVREAKKSGPVVDPLASLSSEELQDHARALLEKFPQLKPV